MEKQFKFEEDHWIIIDLKCNIRRKSICISSTSWTDAEYHAAVKLWVEKIISETWRKLNIFDYWNKSIWQWEYESADWYQQTALTRKNTWLWRQVSAYRIHELLMNEPYQDPKRWWKPHYDFMILDKDLTIDENDWLNYIFWYWPYPCNIISVKRFSQYISDITERLLALAIVWAHEFWHNLSLVSRNFNIARWLLDSWHCAWESWPCLMEQSNTGKKTILEVVHQISQRSNWLCPDCTEEIQLKRSILRDFWYNW